LRKPSVRTYDLRREYTPQQHVVAVTCAIVVIAFVVAYVVWCLFEPLAHRWTRKTLIGFAGSHGLAGVAKADR